MIDFMPANNTVFAPETIARHVSTVGLTSDAAIPLILIAAAPARPPHLAEREELDAALQAGTVDALLLFIDRHPNSRYRAEAEAELRRLGLTSSRPL